jgi:predicted RND superfamily exporter protein
VKTFKIKKDFDLSPYSKIILYYGNRKIHIKEYDFSEITLEPGESVYASQLWTRSKKLQYEDITDNSTYIIKPQLTRLLAYIIFVISLICIVVFIFTRWRWSLIPIIPFVIYVLLFVTILYNRYLKIVPFKKSE